MKNAIGCWLVAAALMALPLAAQRPPETGGLPNKPEPTGTVTGNVAHGKALYYAYGCYACHGYNGETGYRAFVGNWGHLTNEQVFITFLRERANVAPVTPSDRMPNFSAKVMSDKQAKDIYAYIRTFKSSAPQGKDPSLTAIVQAAKQERN